jgi:hypothetical protein
MVERKIDRLVQNNVWKAVRKKLCTLNCAETSNRDGSSDKFPPTTQFVKTFSQFEL